MLAIQIDYNKYYKEWIYVRNDCEYLANLPIISIWHCLDRGSITYRNSPYTINTNEYFKNK